MPPLSVSRTARSVPGSLPRSLASARRPSGKRTWMPSSNRMPSLDVRMRFFRQRMPLELMRGRACTASTPAAVRSTTPANSFERFTRSLAMHPGCGIAGVLASEERMRAGQQIGCPLPRARGHRLCPLAHARGYSGSVHFELQAECPDTGARAGLLHTAHGVVETPVFMPVGTQATVKGVPQRDLENDLDAGIILANTYHLFLRPGHELIRKLGGLHKFMAWPRAILTDSGGFQVFSLSDLRKITDEGVLFRSHLDGDAHLFTPESVVDVQLALGSDIMMALDECLAYPASHEAANQAMLRTVRWAQAADRHHRHVTETTGSGSALFPIVQGSMFADLRRACVTE